MTHKEAVALVIAEYMPMARPEALIEMSERILATLAIPPLHLKGREAKTAEY